MAKAAYIGLNSSATAITASNISQYFTVTNGEYYFVGSGSEFASNNAGQKSTIAQTTLTAKSAMIVSFGYSYSTEEKYDKFTLTVAGTAIESEVSGATTSKTYSGSLNAGDSIVFTYAKDSSMNDNDDVCKFYSMSVSDGASFRKIKRMYIGVNNVARKVKKGYIGVNGIARLFYSWGDLSYYGVVTSLGGLATRPATASPGSYALITGGWDSDAVYAYSKSLTKSYPTKLSATGSARVGASVGGYSLFTPTTFVTTVDVYSDSLTKSTVSLGVGRNTSGSASFGNYALIAGGYGNNGNVGTVDAFDRSLTRTTPTALSVARESLSGAANGSYAVFAGGYISNDGVCSNAVDAYDTSLTKSTLSNLNNAAKDMLSANVGRYAILGGGIDGASGVRRYYFYDTSLTRSIRLLDRSDHSWQHGATCLMDEYALFNTGWGSTDAIYAFDTSLVVTESITLSSPRLSIGAANVGEYALFAGGQSIANSYTSTVEALTMK